MAKNNIKKLLLGGSVKDIEREKGERVREKRERVRERKRERERKIE
jgi:hypothetical protein